MPKPAPTIAAAYDQIIRVFAADPGVTVGGGKGKKGFGANALRTRDKIFAMVTSADAFVVKLPKKRVDELVAAKAGKRFEPGPGRVMKEWIELDPTAQASWLPLAKEAKAFVAKTA